MLLVCNASALSACFTLKPCFFSFIVHGNYNKRKLEKKGIHAFMLYYLVLQVVFSTLLGFYKPVPWKEQALGLQDFGQQTSVTFPTYIYPDG